MGVKLHVDLETLQLIQGPGLRGAVNSLRFKRGDAARVQVVFLRNGVTPAIIGDPDGLEIQFGIKPRNQYDRSYLVHSAEWSMPSEGDETPSYSCSISFNTEELNSALNIGSVSAEELSEITLMGEITWRETGEQPTSTRTFLVIVENDVNRGTEGIPISAEPAYPSASSVATLADLQGLPSATISERGFMNAQDKRKLDSYPGSEHSVLPLQQRTDADYPPVLSNGQTAGAQVSILSRNIMLVPIFIPTYTYDGMNYGLKINQMIIRAGGTGVAIGSALEVGIYRSWLGLPEERLYLQSADFSDGINPNALQSIPLTDPFTFVEPGPYWFAILNTGSATLPLASAEPWTPLLGNMIGCGLNTTGNPPRALVASVPSGSSLPTVLSDRRLDMRNAVATQSTLRLRVSAPIVYASYEIVT